MTKDQFDYFDERLSHIEAYLSKIAGDEDRVIQIKIECTDKTGELLNSILNGLRGGADTLGQGVKN
jgi:hypothetical protein